MKQLLLRRYGTTTSVFATVALTSSVAFFMATTPRSSGCRLSAKPAQLKSNLKVYRNAIDLFHEDTGMYPLTIRDLSGSAAPSKGMRHGRIEELDATRFKGPYLDSVMTDPISGFAFLYNPKTHQIMSSAKGNHIDGTAYQSW